MATQGSIILKEVTTSMGWKAKGKRIALRTSYETFNLNSEDLLSTIELVEGKRIPEGGFGVHSFDIDGREWFIHEIHIPVYRGLSNYLTSAFALRDRTYRTNSFVEKSMGHSDIKARGTSVFLENPTRAFLQDLRNFFAHSGGVVPTYIKRFDLKDDGAPHMEQKLCYQRDKALTKQKWTRLSKQYINSWDKEKRLEDIVREYSTTVRKHYEWLLEYYDKTFSDSYIRTEQMIQNWREKG
jgi:hypothetical protein